MRLPLVPDADSRDGSTNKDERLTNVLSENDEGEVLACVRPGLNLDAQASGVGNGIVVFNDELVSVYGATLGSVATASMGTGWSKVSTSEIPGSVVSSGTMTLAIGGSVHLSQDVYSTTDGSNWTLCPPFPEQLYQLNGQVQGAYFDGYFYFVNYSTRNVYRSADGNSWSLFDNIPAGGHANWPICLVSDGYNLYAYVQDDIGNHGYISSGGSFANFGTTDQTWGVALCNLIFANGVLYIFDVDNTGTIFTSTNCLSFTDTSVLANQISIFRNGTFFGTDVGTNPARSLTMDISLNYSDVGSTDADLTTIPTDIGNPFVINGREYLLAGNGIYVSGTSIMNTVGTVVAGTYDFAQSPL